MEDDQFTRLFTFLQNEFKKVNEKLDQKASRDSMERLLITLDAFLNGSTISKVINQPEITNSSDH